MKLVIDRNTWLRGEGCDDSFLLRPSDNKMCCLGFLSETCQVPLEAIESQQAPSDVPKIYRSFLPKFLFREDDENDLSGICLELMEANDDEYFGPKEREAQITQLFAENGIEVEFVN
jgi:hypothetical protein